MVKEEDEDWEESSVSESPEASQEIDKGSQSSLDKIVLKPGYTVNEGSKVDGL